MEFGWNGQHLVCQVCADTIVKQNQIAQTVATAGMLLTTIYQIPTLFNTTNKEILNIIKYLLICIDKKLASRAHKGAVQQQMLSLAQFLAANNTLTRVGSTTLQPLSNTPDGSILSIVVCFLFVCCIGGDCFSPLLHHLFPWSLFFFLVV